MRQLIRCALSMLSVRCRLYNLSKTHAPADLSVESVPPVVRSTFRTPPSVSLW